MKKLYFLIAVLFTGSMFAQNKLSRLDKTDMETSILFSSFPVININDYQTNINSVHSFYQAYKAISENDIQNRLSSLSNLENKAKTARINNIVPLAILNTDFETIKPEAYTNGNVILDNEGFLVKTQNPASIYSKSSLSISSPLHTNHKGLNVIFNLSSNNIFNTTVKKIASVKVDFGNSEGFKTITQNQNIQVAYSTAGNKTLITQLTFLDGTVSTSKSTLKIKYSNADLYTQFNRVVNTFTSTNTAAPNLTPYGEANEIGTGEYEIFYSDDGNLDKPIFVIDGFDPGDGRPISGYTDTTDPANPVYVNGIYDLLNFTENGSTSNLGDQVRAEGFDIVILNFPVYTRASDMVEVDGGADFIERNAMLLVELIGIINTLKAENGNENEENVIIGPSMGGLISRYALTYMEKENIDHDTRLWMSFDSPHQGANVPIGFQYLFNKLAYGLQLGGFGGDQSVVSIRPLVDGFLKSPAARQMLVDHFEAHITSGTDFDSSLMLPQKHPWSDFFFNGLNDLNATSSGFPENLRKVSLINGSGLGNAYQDKNGADILPDFLALNVSNLPIGSGLTASTADFTTRFTPLAGQQNTAASIFINTPFLCFCGNFNASATVQSETFTDGVDAGSGGLFDIGGLSGGLGSDPLIASFFAGLQTEYFNFIPTKSAMSLANQQDYYAIPNPNNGTPENETPFDAWYMPDNNEGHVTLTSANVNFALDEIIIRSNLAAKIILQGAALSPNTGEENLMRDDLRIADLIPTTSPYTDGLTCDATVFDTLGNDAIVDWVWVELRDTTDSSVVVASQSALLQRDGDIVNIDGMSSLPFNNIPANNYFVAIKHRNHLGVMSNTSIALSRLQTTVDFTDGSTATYGINAQSSFGLPSGTFGLWVGNANSDTEIRYQGSGNDTNAIKDTILADTGNTTNTNLYSYVAYDKADINMNGAIRYQGSDNDSNIIKDVILSHPENTSASNLFFFLEQLPPN